MNTFVRKLGVVNIDQSAITNIFVTPGLDVGDSIAVEVDGMEGEGRDVVESAGNVMAKGMEP